jgi:N-acetylmuramoyl-L-alanine amidase
MSPLWLTVLFTGYQRPIPPGSRSLTLESRRPARRSEIPMAEPFREYLFQKKLALTRKIIYYISMLREKVEEALEKIREGLKTEGGDIELVDIKGTEVYVRLQGACSTCPMSELTMKNWVETNLKKELPEITSFIAALFVLVAVFMMAAPPVSAQWLCKVKGVRHWSSDDYTRVVVDITGSISYQVKQLRNPDRLYIDIKQSMAVPAACGDVNIENGLLRQIRTAQFDKETVRVVLDLASVHTHKVFELSSPSRLVIDVFGAVQPPASQQKPKTVYAKKKAFTKKTVFAKKRVVLDPGHGGKDPGALGPGRLKEKAIVLDISKRVKRILEKEGYEVILTRGNDKYLSLEERTVIANTKQADLFVSVHANANKKRQLRGLETYFLNYTDSEEAMKVAARENKISLKRMKQQKGSELNVIFASLERDYKREKSMKLANFIQDSMVKKVSKRYSRINNHGVRSALFYVLFGARMPSVLVEVSYLTNYEEAKRLKSSRYREYLAQGIARGIVEYFEEEARSIQKIAKR